MSLIRQLLAGLSSVPDGPIIALASDFGARDSYVGVVKAVIAGINPKARVIDITHEIGPHDIQHGAYALWSSYRFFPKGSILVGVVDPGVGTERAILIAETPEHTLLAPDNGLLDLVLSDEAGARVHVVHPQRPMGKWRRYAMGEISRTFHGRDIFAPIAAHLSLGVRPEQIGEPQAMKAPTMAFCDPTGSRGKPSILHIDTFGNVITNVRPPGEGTREFSIRVGGRQVTGWVGAYAEAPAGKPSLIVGSSGLVEIILRNGNAAKALKAHVNTRITLLGS